MQKFNEHFSSIHSIKESIEESGARKWIISGRATMADKPNLNNRIYPKAVMDAAISRLKPAIEARKVKMSLDHPDWTGKLSDCAAILTDLTPIQEDGFAYYTAQIIDTSKGKELKAILDAGASVGVSTRGYGEAMHDQEYPGLTGRYTIIKDGFNLESIDFVDGPSVKDTEDDVHLENANKEKQMKTLEALRKEHPEAFVDFDKAIADEKKALTDAVESVKSEAAKIAADLTKTVESKDTEIKTLTESLNAANVAATELKSQITKIESEKILAAKESEIAKIKSDDADYFKVEKFVKAFEACNTAEEVRTMYESNKEIMKSIIESTTTVAAPKTQTPEPKKVMNESQKRDFEFKNQQRLNAGMNPMTSDEYITKFVK